MELSAMTATLSPLPMPRAWRALARRLTRSWSWEKVRLSPSQARATRSGTTDEAIIRNSDVFIRYLRSSGRAHRRCLAIRGRPRNQVIHMHHYLAVSHGHGKPVQPSNAWPGHALPRQVVCLTVAGVAEPARLRSEEHTSEL